MNRQRLLRRLLLGHAANVSFNDFRRLVESFGFEEARVSGSHHIFGHPQIPQQLNLQDVDGQAKPYQIRQFLRLIERHNLRATNGET